MNAMMTLTRTRRRQRGFTILEALVSLLVFAFGMMALAAFQLTLSRSTDVAKQRTEATRLAQEKLEQLRAFGNLTDYANQMVSSTVGTQETFTTNATYTRTWGVSAAGSVDTGRAVYVDVSWLDRTGAQERVRLLSNVSASDPAEVGGLWFPLPDGTILRRPKDRSIDIPIPAIAIPSTDKSYIAWTAGTFLVFSNLSGDIVLKCTATPTAGNIGNTNVCTPSNGYILSGYVSGNLVGSASGMAFSSTAWMGSTPECVVGDATDQNTGATLSGFKYYTCLIEPTDHDSNAATARVWTGRLDVTGSFGSGTKTCRYTTDASTTDNNKHPATYTLVDRSLDNQNFNVTSSGSCGTGSVLHKTN